MKSIINVEVVFTPLSTNMVSAIYVEVVFSPLQTNMVSAINVEVALSLLATNMLLHFLYPAKKNKPNQDKICLFDVLLCVQTNSNGYFGTTMPFKYWYDVISQNDVIYTYILNIHIYQHHHLAWSGLDLITVYIQLSNDESVRYITKPYPCNVHCWESRDTQCL